MMKTFKSMQLIEQHPFVSKFVWITFTIIAIFIGLLFLPWQQTIHGTGRLTALDPTQRDYTVLATVNGFVEKFYVHENQFVHKGDKLFRMRDLDTDYQSRLSAIFTHTQEQFKNEMVKLKNLQKNLHHQKKNLLVGMDIYDKKLQQSKNSASALKKKRLVLYNRNIIEHKNYERSRSLHTEGIVSTRDLELKKSTYLHTEAELKKIVVDIENIQSEMEIITQEKQRFHNEIALKLNTIKNGILSTQNLANKLKQKMNLDSTNIERYSSRDVIAKNDGYVIRIYQNDQNRLIKYGEKVLYFSPKITQKAILLKLSDFNMPLIKKDLKVRIIFYGWPSLHISGWPNIKHGTYAGMIKSIEQSSYENGAYYAIVVEDPAYESWPSNEYLKVGTQSSLWVRLSTVKVWYELWRLMASQPPKMFTVKKGKQ